MSPIVSFLMVGALAVTMERVQGSSPSSLNLDSPKMYTSTFDELRESLKDELTEDYMQENLYLAKWLFEYRFDVPKAQEKLRKHLLWRKEQKIATILDEDWDDMNALFPYSRATKDVLGRPLLYLDTAEWDVSTYIGASEANSERLARYLVKMLEESEEQVRQLRAKNEPISQFNIILNFGGYTNSKHMCIQCLYFYRNVGELLAAHFPQATDRNVFVNVPTLFKVAYTFLTQENQESIFLYGQDQTQWEPAILEFVEKDQVPRGLLESGSLIENANSEGFMQWSVEL